MKLDKTTKVEDQNNVPSKGYVNLRVRNVLLRSDVEL